MDEGENGGDRELRKVRNESGKKMVVGERNVKERQNESRVNYGE